MFLRDLNSPQAEAIRRKQTAEEQRHTGCSLNSPPQEPNSTHITAAAAPSHDGVPIPYHHPHPVMVSPSHATVLMPQHSSVLRSASSCSTLLWKDGDFFFFFH